MKANLNLFGRDDGRQPRVPARRGIKPAASSAGSERAPPDPGHLIGNGASSPVL